MDDLERAQSRLLAEHLPGAVVRELKWSHGRTRVIEAGTGPDVLLVHGGLGDSFAWIPILPVLAGGLRVHAVDLPGHGLADPFDFSDSDLLHLMAGFLNEVIEGLRLRSPAIVASSLGGSFAIAHAVNHPATVSRIVVLGMPGGYKRSIPLPLRMLGLPLIGQPLGRVVMSNPSKDGNRKFWGQLLVRHPERVPDGVIQADVASQTRNKTSQLSFIKAAVGARGLRTQMLLGDSWQRIAVPVLLLWGEADVYGEPQEAMRLVERNANLQLVRIPEAGHLPWFDAPDQVTTEIRRFLDGNVDAPAHGLEVGR